MNKIAMCASLALLAVAGYAAETKIDPKYIMTPEQAVQHRKMMDMKRFGGVVRKPNSAKGKVVFLNAQKLVPAASLKSALVTIDEETAPIWELKDVPSVKLANPSAEIKAADAKLGVVLVDSPDIPALVLAPEAGWAEVNVAALKADAKDADALARRTRVELLRAYALVAGAAFMARDPEVLRPDVIIPRDLDMIKSEQFGVDAKMAIARGLPGRGVTPWKQASYRQACKEGWAASPTNDVQKKIWNKAHELPTKPMKIEFDPKKGE